MAIPSHDTDHPRFLRLRVRVSCPLSRMDAGRSQRVSRGLGQTVPTQGRQGVLSLPRAWTSPVFYTTGPRRGEVAREATRNRNRNSCVSSTPKHYFYEETISAVAAIFRAVKVAVAAAMV